MRERYATMGASKNRQRNPKRSNSKRRAVVFEPLEPRLLLSADLAFGSDGHHAQYADEGWERRGAGTGPAFSDTSFHSADYDPDPLAAPDPHLQPEANSQYWPLPDPLDLIALRSLEDQREQGASTETASPADNAVSYELVLVDASVQGYETLVSDLMAQDDEARRIQIHVLDTATDGIEQVSEILSGYRGLGAIHVISHGDQTGLDLGNGRLDASSLERDREALQSWADALTDDADLLLYGCNLAVSPDGAALLVALGELIGVDVAASSDLTGSAVLGGDWDLEFEAGSIEAGVVLGAQAQQRWNGVLASFTVNDTSDTVDTNPGDGLAQDASGNTTLRAAVMEANALAGADVINVPAGTYFLTLDGDDEFAALGDLDLWGNLSIVGAGAQTTFIDGNDTDRVIHSIGGADIDISGVTIQNGSDVQNGGGILVDSGSVLGVSNSIIADNVAVATGAGVRNDGVLNLTDVVIRDNGNPATNVGGGLANYGDATLERVAISGNQADTGGGIDNENSATNLKLVNVTISGNSADTIGGGMRTRELVTITNSTITANIAADGGGIALTGGSADARMLNSIVAGNTAGNSAPDVMGSVSSLGYNIVGDTTGGGGFVGTDKLNTNPDLDAALSDNGGFTPTHALLGTSVAINAGESTGAPATDQRGYARVGTLDIGAYEFGGAAAAAPVAVGDAYTMTEDGSLDSNDEWFDSNWAFRQTLSFDNGAQSENLTEFPVLVTLDSTRIDYAQTQNNGEDIRFVDGDGTVLAHEIEEWNEAGTSYVWVKVPQVDANSSQDFIWMYYGNAGAADGQNAAAVWSNGYRAVYHLDENPGGAGTLGDATGNFDGTNTGTTDVAGRIGQGQEFDGASQYVDMGSNQPFLNSASGATISAWLRADATNVGNLLGVSIAGGPSDASRVTLNLNSDRLRLSAISDDAEAFRAVDTAAGILNTGTWYHVTGVVNFATGEMSVYVDGVQLANATVGFNASATPGSNSALGAIGANETGGNSLLDGALDEVRLSNTARSGDWVAAQYASTNDSFLTYGYQQTVAGVLGNDTDPDGDSLTAALVAGPGNAAAFSLNPNGSFTYTPAANFSGTDSFQYRSNDGTFDSNLATVTITVSAENDQLAASNLNQTRTYNEDDPSVAIDDIVVTDPDSGEVVTATLTLADTSAGSLTTGTFGTTTSTYTAGTGVWQATGNVTNVNAALAAVAFTPATHYEQDTSITVSIADGGEDGTVPGTGTIDLDVTAVNDAPVLTGLDATPTFVQGGAAVPLDGDGTVSDVELDVLNGGNGDYSGATLTLRRNGGANAEDVFDVPAGGSLSVGIGTISVGANSIANFTTVGGQLQISFVNTGTVPSNALVNEVLQSITYANSSGSPPASVTIDYTLDDGNGGSQGTGGARQGTGSITVNITATNSAPTGADNTVSTGEDTAYGFATADFGFSDADGGDSLSAVRIDTLPAVGSLTLSGSAVSAGQVIAAADISAGNLEFTPASDGNGTSYANFTFSVRDQANAFDPAPNTMTLDVTAVNDAPTGTDNTVVTNEDTAHTFSTGDFGFGDVDAGDTLSAVRFDSLPAAGSFTLSGIPVSAGQVIAAADISAGNLEFTPASDSSGAGYASFTFSVRDQSSAFDTAPNRMTVDVSAVNDAPTIANFGKSANEDAVITFSAADFSSAFADIEGDALTQIRVTALPSDGVLALFGAAVAVNDVIAAAQLGNLTFTPSANWNGATSFNWRAHDGSDWSTGTASVKLTITAVNDAPGAVGDSYTLSEGTPATITSNGVLANDADLDGDALTAQLVSGPAHGSLALNSDGTFVYVPNTGFSGTDSFVYRAHDGVAASNLATVTLTVNPTPPAPALPSAGDTSGGTAPPPDPKLPVGVSPLELGGDVEGELPTTGDPLPDSPPSEPLPSPFDPSEQVERAPGGDPSVAETQEPTDESIAESGTPPVDESTADDAVTEPVAPTEPTIRTGAISQGARTGDFSFLQRDSDFENELNALREEVDTAVAMDQTIVGSSAVMATGISVGYVLWMTRGGLLLLSLVSSMPAWRLVDPIPVLARLKSVRPESGDDAESLTSILEGSSPQDPRHESPDRTVNEAALGNRSESALRGATGQVDIGVHSASIPTDEIPADPSRPAEER